MVAAVRKMYAATYVRDVDASRAFYELLGFREHSTGRAATSAWCSMYQGDHHVLLASTSPPLPVPSLPLLFYFAVDDIDAVIRALSEAGIGTTHMGCPPHALGGEVKLTDPDGNTVLVGQEERSAGQAPLDDDGSPHFSLLKEAAEVVAARGGTTAVCGVNTTGRERCTELAEVKLADSGGEAVWACLEHAHEVLVRVPAAFIANQDDRGIAQFLALRRG